MNTVHRLEIAAALSLAAFALAPTWADGAPAPTQPDLTATEARQRAALMAAIGTPRCTADSQCQVIGIGARPCGGAESHAAYSTLTASPPKLKRLAQAHASTRRTQDSNSGRMGICMVLPEPKVQCQSVAQRCELVVETATPR